jgi:hypothetical protein
MIVLLFSEFNYNESSHQLQKECTIPFGYSFPNQGREIIRNLIQQFILNLAKEQNLLQVLSAERGI